MASWILIEAGKSLFAAFDALAPDRDHASDGSIGDAAHAAEVSDHNPDETGSVPIHDADKINEVHAVDVDSDLRTPGLSMETCVQFILSRCRAGAEKRLRYVIYNRRIWEASNGWDQRAYTGSSAHTEHAHFSFSYVTSLEASTASWHLEEIPVSLTPSDLDKIQGIVDDRINELLLKQSTLTEPDGTTTVQTPIGKAVLSQPVPRRAGEKRVMTYVLLADLGAGIDAANATLNQPPTP
jgi:hypothetical protein